jgi:hypothetical protein
MTSQPSRIPSRICLQACIPALLVLALAAPAAAQNAGGQFLGELIEIGDRPPAEFDLQQIPINHQECVDDIEVVVRLENLPRRNIVALWVGSECNRDRTLMTNCRLIKEHPLPISAIGPGQTIPFEDVSMNLSEALLAFDVNCEN